MTGARDFTPVIAIRELEIRYRRVAAVTGLSLDVPRGCVCALLGRNGAGKTSVVKALLGQLRARAGSVNMFGRDVWRERRLLMMRVGVVPERPEVPPSMTARELGRLSRALYGKWDDAAFSERLERFHVPSRQPFGSLSKGQQRQLSLALALGCKPELLVLDDPTLGLDPVARRELYEELIGELADRGTTVFLTTHDLAGVEGIADRVAIMRQGSLEVEGPLEELKAGFRRLVSIGDVGSRLRDTLRELDPVTLSGAEGRIEAVVGDWDEAALPGMTAAGFSVEPLSLEEIFVALCEDRKEAAP